jgi:hypothetical protein
MADAPTDPFRLLAHLEDDHDLLPETIGWMESDDLRALHEQLHRSGGIDTPEHSHS